MCTRYVLFTSEQKLSAQFNAPMDVPLRPRYNISAGQPVIVIRQTGGRREAVALDWGLVPSWSNEPSKYFVNARSETMFEKPAFRGALRYRRCLIPADGFYEWQKLPGGKQAFYIRRADKKPFAFAGLWDDWSRPEGDKQSCAIVTTSANSEMAAIHERMPVILGPESYRRWLDPDLFREVDLMDMMVPLPNGVLETIPVSPLVDNPRNDSSILIEPIQQEPTLDL